jgi:hypothetical protein
VADLDQLGLHEPVHLGGLEQQVLAGVALAVAGEDQVGDLAGVVGGVLPAAQAGPPEGVDARAVVANLRLGGEQRVAVEVDAAGARRERAVGEAAAGTARRSNSRKPRPPCP